MKRPLQLFLVLLTPVLLFSCGGGNSNSEVSEVDSSKIASDTIDDTDSKVAEAKNIYYSIPSTSEMAELLQDAGATYDLKLLNDINIVDKYATSRQQAINLGIYGADLNYCTIFERTNETMFYMECTNALSDKLQIANAISDETITRAEENIDNRDSMLQIISDMFYELQEYLAENDKDDISALVIGGGWIEGLYLATQTVNDNKPNQKIMTRIAEQKYSLSNMMKFLDQYKASEDVQLMIEDFKKLEAIYADIVVVKEKTEVTTDAEGMTVIGGPSKTEITIEQFKALKSTVKEIRNGYVKI